MVFEGQRSKVKVTINETEHNIDPTPQCTVPVY